MAWRHITAEGIFLHLAAWVRGRSAQRLLRQLTRERGFIVSAGPFRGMRYGRAAHGSELLPKLLGTYESELHAAIEQLSAMSPPVVVDIGCAEGYYAVGLARRLLGTHVLAYDSSPRARDLCRNLAEVNGVGDRVSVRAECSANVLAELVRPRWLLIVDCEGCEIDLFRPEVVTAAAECWLIVETHDAIRPGSSRRIAERFARTHRITWVATRAAGSPKTGPSMSSLNAYYRRLACDENRIGRQEWAVIYPRHRP